MVTACEELEKAASSGTGTIQDVCKVKELQKSYKCMKFHSHEEANAGSMLM